MEKGIDIYNYDLRLERAIKAVLGSALSKRNKELILGFRDQAVIEGIGKPRIVKYLGVLRIFGVRLGKDFDRADIQDLKRVMMLIQGNSSYSVLDKAFLQDRHKEVLQVAQRQQ
jgi:hypothetical protein